jgi:predicted RNase H-like nuclease (RuvC/YqgF family)
VISWLRERRETQDADDTRGTKIDTAIAQSADAAIVAMSKTIDALQDENQRLVNRVTDLEQALAARDRKIEDLEARLRRAERDLRLIADELAVLKNHGDTK